MWCQPDKKIFFFEELGLVGVCDRHRGGSGTIIEEDTVELHHSVLPRDGFISSK